jgi:hypothetical protein
MQKTHTRFAYFFLVYYLHPLYKVPINALCVDVFTSPRRETSLFNSPGIMPGFFLPKFQNPIRTAAHSHNDDG